MNKTDNIDDKMFALLIYIKEWLTKQHHLPNCNDKLLNHIVAASKGNKETACKKLDSYFTVRTLMPDFYQLRDPLTEEMESSNRCVMFGLIPGVTYDGCKVMMISLTKDGDASKFEPLPFIRRMYMYYDLILVNDELQPGQGLYYLIDVTGGSINHLLKFTPSLLKKATFCTQDVYPLLVKGFLHVNVNDFLRITINTLIVPFFPQKLRKRIQFFGSKFDKVHTIVPNNILPVELGGSGLTYREISERATQSLVSKRMWFLNEGSIPSDESKRSGQCPISAPGCSIM